MCILYLFTSSLQHIYNCSSFTGAYYVLLDFERHIILKATYLHFFRDFKVELNKAADHYADRFEDLLSSLTPQQKKVIVPPWALRIIINNNPDVHNVAMARGLFMCEHFHDSLRATGSHHLAVMFLTYHEWFEALDCRGLTLDDRSLRINRLSVLVHCIHGRTLFKPGSLTLRLQGMTYQQAMSILTIESARFFVLEKLTPNMRLVFNSQTLGTDKCEFTFSEVTRLCGQRKPTFALCEAALEKVNFRVAENMRHIEDRGYPIPDKPDTQYPNYDLNFGGRASRLPFNDIRAFSIKRASNAVIIILRKFKKAGKQLSVRQLTLKQG
jgi:hypothetical protein